jgi:acetyl coenzyme A synthetase (ADP forming)-like protein
MKELKYILKPKSVVIVGASRTPGKVGHIILQNYINDGYSGNIYLVNKNEEEILGMRSYSRVTGIKAGSIDLAVIAVPAEAVPEVLEDCGKAGVKSAVVVSGGFAEIGKQELQDEIVKIAKKYKIAMIGPNCLGVMDPRSRVNTLFLPSYKLAKPEIGGISFVAQSGAVGSTVLDLMAGEGFGISKFISYGNAADIDEVDILEYLMEDEETKVIAMYIEGIKRGRDFIELGKKITKKKPVIILKAGRTAAGATAAHSHTAALAGSYEAHEAVFRQFGFTIANDISELLYYSKIFASEAAPVGSRIGIITNGGGAGVLTTDAIASSRHMSLGELSEKSKADLRKVMPPLVNITNPLDLAGDADDKRYRDALTSMASDPGIDMIIVIILFQTPGADSRLAAEVVAMKEKTSKPMVVLSIGSEYTEMHKMMMERSGLPVYDSPRAVALSLEALYSYYQYKNHSG